jgi:hypothetical protein
MRPGGVLSGERGVAEKAPTPKTADLSAEASAKAEAGMVEMSERYREGGDLFVPATE